MSELKSRYEKVINLWKKFITDEPTAYSEIISKEIYESWQRSKASNIDPFMKKIALVLEQNALSIRLRRNAELIELCKPFMDNLYNLVRGSGFTVALFDSDGILLHIIGDNDILNDLTIGNFVAGSCWREEIMGTNGVGTILHIGKPLQIFACEHFAKLAHPYTCSGAPICSPEGDIVGVIDMTGFYHSSNSHTLGMVMAAATAIGNLLVVNQAFKQCQVSENLQKTVVASITEALIAVDNDGIITLVNQNAEQMFKQPSGTMLGKDYSDVFGTGNAHLTSLIDNNRTLTDREVRITFNDNMASDYTLTCNPILSPQKRMTGKIIAFTAIKRTRQLVTSMMGAKAKLGFEDIIGKNPAFLQNVELAKIAASSDSNVLLLGESGTGKDIIAQSIHNKSNRRKGPYLAINCASIPRDLIASELFGYDEGAFTGSKRGGNPGKFELAEGGSIFLDEIGEMPLELQSTLLRIIEEKTILRIGAKKIRNVDVRIIAATNINLHENLERKTFREDLFYRLNIFSIKLVPLRDRLDDIPLLVDHFVKNLASKIGKNINKVHPNFIHVLEQYSWPGNIRELQNYIERAINITSRDELTVDLLPPELTRNIVEYQSNNDKTGLLGDHPAETNLETIEKNLIMNMIQANYSRKEIAQKLGYSRSTLYRKIRQLKNVN
jgi:sigma-54 dependent transcriptional regulator, acetoin dehydrogenase operon transcriptional activator AcoR